MRLLVCLLVSLIPASLWAQTPSMEVSDAVSVDYVMIPFTALGSKGTPITDLSARDVRLFVDGVRVESDLFEKSMNAPVSFIILLDGSGSMALAGKMEGARAAVQALLASRKPGDDFALYVFDHETAHELVPFTEDPRRIVDALETVKPYGKTAFFDALATMPQRSAAGKNPTRAIILLSDGIDNASRLTRLQLAAKLEGVAVPIYALAPRDPAERSRSRRGPVSETLSDIQLLEEIATSTGGRLFLGTKPQHFVTAVAGLDRALRAQYLIGFPPTGKGEIKYRRISLQLAGRARAVRVRAGYRGTEPPKTKERKASS